MKVIKRDGRIVDFDKHRITNAVLKAYKQVDGKLSYQRRFDAESIADRIELFCQNDNNDYISVEQIQDLVEQYLMETSRKDVAKAYIIYRNDRTRVRESKSELSKEITNKLYAKSVENQNANVDEHSFGGRMGAATSAVTKDYALNYCMSEMAKNNHLNNEIYIHDLDHYAIGDHNCLSVPFDKLLANGFNTRQTDVRPAQSVGTAFQLVAVIFQLQSLQQFGGVSATHLDWTMIPYVRKSFYKHFKNGAMYLSNPRFYKWFNGEVYKNLKSNPNIPIDKFKEYIAEYYDTEQNDNLDSIYQYAMDMTEKEIYQAVEGLYHNLNTLQSRSGNQLPFTSINYGTCTKPEGRMITKALLEVLIKGIGKLHKTSIFPCGIFQVMKGVNKEPDTPNYDLYRLALKSTSLRLYPNYANVDWSNNKGYDVNNPETYFSTMGCVDGEELITYYIDDILYVESFKRMWNRISDLYEVKAQPDNVNHYIDCQSSGRTIKIYDTNKRDFVEVKKLIRNLSDNWLNIKFSHGRSLLCTTDHPIPTVNRGRVFAKDLTTNDIITINSCQYSKNRTHFNTDKAWLLGMILCDGCYDGNVNVSIAFENENDIQDKYIERMKKCFNNDVEIVERHRGVKGKYKDLRLTGNATEIIDYLSCKFEGLTKNRRHIPNDVFSWNREARLAFMAGMIDADGYINSTTHGGSIVQIGSTNKELSLQQLALAQSLNMAASLYQNHYGRGDNIRYRIEFVPTKELINYIVSQKKKDNYIEGKSQKHYTEAKVNSIENIELTQFSYDVETESDTFEVSGIYSHNCRTANLYDINGLGQLKDGRGNICPVTIIMPTLAMKAKENFVSEYDDNIVEIFMDILDKKIHEAKDMLIERFDWICSQSPNSAKFMYENGLMEGYIPEEGIRSALKHGTLALGQLGLAETLQILIGKDHTTDEGMKLAKRIEQLFKDRCAEFKNEYKLNFGVYYTPAENLCFTAMKKFKDTYGEIPNVSDKKFFTNSIHVPVWKEITPFEKIDIESQLTGYSSAGCITYVELPSSAKNNIDALETIVNYAMDNDIPYFAINVPNDTCLECGYTDEIGNICPKCGSKNIQRLRRVTGYLTGDYKTAFNEGKQQETEMRAKHIK